MAYSFREIVELILPSMPPTLITAQSASSLREVAAHYPSLLGGGFELRLAADQPQVDLFQIVTRLDRSRLIGDVAAHFLDNPQYQDPLWLGLHNVLSYWHDHAAELDELIYGLSLELRYKSVDGPPRPAIAFGLSAAATLSGHVNELVAQALRHFLGDQETTVLLANLRQHLPSPQTGATLRLLGIGIEPLGLGLRPYLRNLRVAQLIPYLESIGWQGRAQEVYDLAVWLARYNEALDVHLDLIDTVGPRLGFKIFGHSRGRYDPRLAALLDDLVGRGLCAPEKRDALRTQVWTLTPLNSTLPWPDHLILDSLSCPEPVPGAFYSYLQVIKVAYEPGKALEAKAYIYCNYI